MFKGIDLSSDTATKPTDAMKQAMMQADVGDEQKGEDPTTRRLEEMTAEMLGFSAALFFPSATMANEVAICCLSDPGNELLAAQNAHLFVAETGGPAVHAKVLCKPIATDTGKFNADSVKRSFTWSNSVHLPLSSVLSIENTTNMGGGFVWSQEELNEVVQCADALGLKKHMDGARLFNASVKTGLSLKAIAHGFDIVTICLSKGLGCPVGALLAFDQSQYQKVRRTKQLMGGSMRQSGILAAAGIYALENHIAHLQTDHEHAALLARELNNGIPQIHVINHSPETNLILFDWVSDRMNSTSFHERCIEKGLRFSQLEPNRFRAVTHRDITQQNIYTAIKLVRDVCSGG